MKKCIGFVVVFLVLFLIPSAYAHPGDVIGRFYSTDIKTYLNGAEIDAINIGGQTLINAEVMHEYGFYVYWNPLERTLSVNEKKIPYSVNSEYISAQKLPTGTVLGYYYETDIVTSLDGKPITAYNTGGQTYIHAEEMSKFGYTVTWYPDERKLDVRGLMHSGYVYSLKLCEGQEKTQEGVGYFSVRYGKDGIERDGDTDYFDFNMHSDGKGYSFDVKFYQNDGLFYSSKLQNILKELCYDGYGIENPVDKSEKYDFVNEIVTVSINGQRADKVSVTSGAGNGHRDFYFFVEGLPKLKIDEINEIVFCVNSIK